MVALWILGLLLALILLVLFLRVGVRIAFGVAGPVPLRALNAEAFINGREVTLENIQQFGRTVLEDIRPRDSWRASKAFRSHIAVESAKRCLMESVKLAGGEL